MTMKGTTICAVKRGDQVAIAGDGQVTMGENTVFKSSAKKVRRLYEGKVIAGFAGAVAAIWNAPRSIWRRNGAVTAPSESWKAC